MAAFPLKGEIADQVQEDITKITFLKQTNATGWGFRFGSVQIKIYSSNWSIVTTVNSTF